MESVPPGQIYADLTLPDGSTWERPYIAINMVGTVDGRATVDGKASSIGSDVDRGLMRNIPSAFDAVLVGAGTLRKDPVVDRTLLIIRMFEAHARDSASRLEVELAELTYRLPRVRGGTGP